MQTGPVRLRFGRWWRISADAFIEYGCTGDPDVRLKIRGLQGFGFILSHSFELEPTVRDFAIERCERRGCERAFQMTIELAVCIYDRIGVGINFGGGTGTAGGLFGSHVRHFHLNTPCFCCDDGRQQSPETKLVHVSAERRGETGAVVTTTVLLALLTLAWNNPNNPVSATFLCFSGAALAASALVIAIRLFRVLRIKRRKSLQES